MSSDCILQKIGSHDTLFFPYNVESVPQFTSEPPNPSFVLEGQNITLVWIYILDGSFSFARFINVTSGGLIASRPSGSATSEPRNKRFRADISDSQARLTIHGVQEADEGKYEFDLTASAVIKHTVEVIVQCKLFQFRSEAL